MSPRPSPLARYLFGAYLLLIAYASLHPLVGWRNLGLHPFAFLIAPLPRYYTGFDIGANIAAYVPFGLLAVVALRPLLVGLPAVAVATLGGATLSITLEALQTYLPDRIPSNLDVLTNTMGAFGGAVIAHMLAPKLLAGGGWLEFRDRVFVHGHRADLGLVLIGLWIFTQLNPETLLFGTGDLRNLFGLVPGVLHPAETFIRIETVVAAGNLLAASLLAGMLVPDVRARRIFILGLVVVAVVVRTLAYATLFDAEEALAWATSGAMTGLIVGTVLALAAAGLPRGPAAALAGLLLMSTTAVVNVAPENPYLAHSLQLWPQGHFLNFNGLTRLVSLAWPFAALAYLLVPAEVSKPA
jgi:VanZ family protein